MRNTIGDKMKNRIHPIVVIGILVLSAVILGRVAYAYLNYLNPNQPLRINPLSMFSLSTAAIAVISFYGFMWLGDKKGGEFALNKGGMRLAIVAAVVTVDLVLVSTVAFFTADWEVPPLAETFITQFHTVVSVVVAFYFGASAYVQVQGKDKEDKGGEEIEEKK
jgi:hypothetical protein